MLSKLNQIGRVMVDLQNTAVKFAAVNAAKNGDRALVAAVAGKKIRVLGGELIGTAGDGTLVLTSATGGTALTGVIPIDIAGGSDGQDRLDLNKCPFGCVQTAVGEGLYVTLSANLDLDGWLVYCEV